MMVPSMIEMVVVVTITKITFPYLSATRLFIGIIY